MGATALARTVTGKGTPKPPNRGRYKRWWSTVIDAFGKQRQLWLASVEGFLQAERSPEVRRGLSRGNQEARRGLAAWLLGIDEHQVSDTAPGVSGQCSLRSSPAMVQWISDAEHAPSAQDSALAARACRADREIASWREARRRAHRRAAPGIAAYKATSGAVQLCRSVSSDATDDGKQRLPQFMTTICKGV